MFRNFVISIFWYSIFRSTVSVTKQRTSSFLSQDDKRKDKRGRKKKKGKKSKDIKEDEDEDADESIKPDDETSYNVDNVKFEDIDEDDKQKKKKSKKTSKSGGRISPYTSECVHYLLLLFFSQT